MIFWAKGILSWPEQCFLRIYCADVLVHLNISFCFSNSQQGCCERCTSDMDVRVHRCVRSQFTFPKYLVKISIEALTRMRYIPPNVPPKNTPTHQTQGLYSFSCPMVVASPCPGYTLVSSGSKKSFSRIL